MFHPVKIRLCQPGDVDWEEDGSAVCGFDIAETEGRDRLVRMEARLSPIHLDRQLEGVAEFSFSLICLSFDGSELDFETQDRDLAIGYIPTECRQLVMPAVSRCARILIGTWRPSHLYRVVKTINPPPQALRKHELLTSVFKSIGYEVSSRATDPLGRRLITMSDKARVSA